jgi:hypothetical protein
MSDFHNESTRLWQVNSLPPAIANPLGSSVRLQSSTSEIAPLRPMDQIGNSQHSVWITPSTGSIIQSTKKPSSPASEQEDGDSDPNTTTSRPPVSQLDPLTSESLSSDGFTTITSSPSLGGDRMQGLPSDLANPYRISATRSHAETPKPLSILLNPTLACSHSSVDQGCTGSLEGLADLDLDSPPVISSNLPTNMRLEPLDCHLTITSALVVETFLTPGKNVENPSPKAIKRLRQEILEPAPVQLDALHRKSSSEIFRARRTDSLSWKYSTITMLSLSKVAVASPSNQLNLVPLIQTLTELVSNPVLLISIQLYNTSEQLTGVVQKQENTISLTTPSHSNGREVDSHTHLGSNVPLSHSQAILGLQGSVSSRINPPVLATANESPLSNVIKSVTRSVSHSLTSSATTGGLSGIRTFIKSPRTTSIHSDPVFDHLQGG